jgi:aminoglycoside phosphotransferase (APT) family kinase protein
VSIPRSPGDIDVAFIAGCLAQSGTLREGGVVSDISVQVIGTETGFTGVVARVFLKYTPPEPEEPASLVVKLPMARQEIPTFFQQRAATDPAFRRRAYDRAIGEVHFYERLAKPLHAPSPSVYYAAFDDSEDAVVMVMEDLAGSVGDALGGCSIDQAAAILQSMAPFHAAGWNIALSAATDAAWLPSFGADVAIRTQRYRESLPIFLSRCNERLSTSSVALLERLAGRLDLVIAELAASPRTVLHGDLHLDNIIFGGTCGQPSPVVIDWQGVSLGPAAIDVAFIAGALAPEARRESESRLLRNYFHSLIDSGITDYDFDAFERHYQLAILVGMAGLVTWLASSDMNTVSGRERSLMQAVVERQWGLTAALDHSSGTGLDQDMSMP